MLEAERIESFKDNVPKIEVSCLEKPVIYKGGKKNEVFASTITVDLDFNHLPIYKSSLNNS